MEVRETGRSNTKSICDRLEESEVQRGSIITNINGFQRAEDDFDHRVEDLGVRGYERVRFLVSNIDNLTK